MYVFSVSVHCFQDDLEVSGKEHLCICTPSCVCVFFVAKEDKALKHRSSILAGGNVCRNYVKFAACGTW